MTETIPHNDYETTDGTPAVEHGTHEPRTVKRTTTTGDEVEVHMMSEIGDGVFVQWSQCSSCTKGITTCTCAGGPQEPAYISRWRDARFERSLNARPEIDFEALPGVVKSLTGFGYKVFTKDELAEYREALKEAFAAKPEVEASDDQNAREHKEHTLAKLAEADAAEQ